MNQLQFVFTPIPHPYIDELPSKFEIWGEIKLNLIQQTQVISLFSTQWNLDEMIGWFIEVKERLFEELHLPIPYPNQELIQNKNLCELLDLLRQRTFEDEQEEPETIWFDFLYHFTYTHSLHFALRGANIPEIIIGRNNHCGEISGNTWAYYFDEKAFEPQFHEGLLNALKQAITNCNDEDVLQVWNKLLIQLQ